MASSAKLIHVPLSPLDHIPPQNYVKIGLYLPLRPGVRAEDAFQNLQDGLHRSFMQIPWLGGKVYWQHQDAPSWRPSQLEIRYNPISPDSPRPYQLKLHVLDASYEDLQDRGFPTDEFSDEDLLWAPFFADINAGAEVFVAQANFMEDGCLLTMSTCHPSADGTAMITILKLWAQHCRRLQGETDDEPLFDITPESSDRNILDRLWKQEQSSHSTEEMDPAAWHMVGLDHPNDAKSISTSSPPPPVPSPGTPSRVMRSAVFYIPAERFTALRAQCTKDNGGAGDLSSNDIVTALIWRSLMTARQAARSSEDITSTLAELEMTVDGRPDFSHFLPETYLGNVVLINRPTLPLHKLIDPSTPLGTVAQTIRDTARVIHHENMMDAYSLLRGVSDFSERKLRFTTVEGSSMLITSLLAFPIEEICFGDQFFGRGGRPEAFRPLMSSFNHLFRISFILPRARNGGVEFVVSLFDEEMGALEGNEEFSAYAVLLSD